MSRASFDVCVIGPVARDINAVGEREYLDDAAVAEFRRLKAAKIKIGTMDLRIASIVLANDATLITMNLRDYERMPGLKVEDWTTG